MGASRALPPPVGGWDTESSLTDMPPENAVILDNFFPSTDRVTVRPGYTAHATGLGATVESLLPYTPEDGAGELFGVAGGSIFDVTGAGAAGDILGVHVAVDHRAGGSQGVVPARSDRCNPVFGFQHVTRTGDNEQILAICDDQHRLKLLEIFICTPIFGKFNRCTGKLSWTGL